MKGRYFDDINDNRTNNKAALKVIPKSSSKIVLN
jgi:hypothetical protein